MSVPVDPRVEASDTTVDTASLADPSTAQRFRHFYVFDEADWHHRNAVGWLDMWLPHVPHPITDAHPYTFSSASADEQALQAHAVTEVRRLAAALLLDSVGGDLKAAMQALLDAHDPTTGGAQA